MGRYSNLAAAVTLVQLANKVSEVKTEAKQKKDYRIKCRETKIDNLYISFTGYFEGITNTTPELLAIYIGDIGYIRTSRIDKNELVIKLNTTGCNQLVIVKDISSIELQKIYKQFESIHEEGYLYDDRSRQILKFNIPKKNIDYIRRSRLSDDECVIKLKQVVDGIRIILTCNDLKYII